MDDFIAGPQDGKSDYGSDFIPEEEEILSRVLQSLPPRPVPELDLLPADVDGDENAHAATSLYHARYGSQRRSPHLVQRRNERKGQISVESETSGELHIRWSG